VSTARSAGRPEGIENAGQLELGSGDKPEASEERKSAGQSLERGHQSPSQKQLKEEAGREPQQREAQTQRPSTGGGEIARSLEVSDAGMAARPGSDAGLKSEGENWRGLEITHQWARPDDALAQGGYLERRSVEVLT